MANVRPKGFPFLQFRWRGMPVVGVPGSHDGLNDAGWRSCRAGALRRELYARAVRMSGSWLRQRWWAHGVDTPLPYLAEGDFSRFIDHLPLPILLVFNLAGVTVLSFNKNDQLDRT